MKSRVVRWTFRLLLILIIIVPLALVDMIYIGQKNQWDRFDKWRLDVYLETATWVGFLVPPVGPLAVIHHGALIFDAYIDKDFPPTRTMNFLRKLVMSAPDFQRVVATHEIRAAKRYTAQGAMTFITCLGAPKNGSLCNARRAPLEVPFFLGVGDHFNMLLRTDFHAGKPTTAFFVYGLGIVAADNPQHIARKVPSLSRLAVAMNQLVRRLEDEGLAQRYYVNLTESPATSRFSTPTDRTTIKAWMKQVQQRHTQ
jgi:hypothetical protein